MESDILLGASELVTLVFIDISDLFWNKILPNCGCLMGKLLMQSLHLETEQMLA